MTPELQVNCSLGGQERLKNAIALCSFMYASIGGCFQLFFFYSDWWNGHFGREAVFHFISFILIGWNFYLVLNSRLRARLNWPTTHPLYLSRCLGCFWHFVYGESVCQTADLLGIWPLSHSDKATILEIRGLRGHCLNSSQTTYLCEAEIDGDYVCQAIVLPGI